MKIDAFIKNLKKEKKKVKLYTPGTEVLSKKGPPVKIQ